MSALAFRLGEVLEVTGGRLVGEAPLESRLRGVGVDSRSIRPAELFVALPGQKHDGHDFVAEALARGAATALVERVPAGLVVADGAAGPPLVVVPSTLLALQALARRRRTVTRPIIITICGSVGKATTAELIQAVLGQDRPAEVREARSSPAIRVALAMANLAVEESFLILEVAPADEGEAEALLDLAPPEVVVVTSVEATLAKGARSAEQQGQLFERLVQSIPAAGALALNTDEPLAAQLTTRTSAAVWSYGLGANAAVRGERVASHGARGSELDLTIGHRRVHVRLRLVGQHSVHSALAAAAVGLSRGLDLSTVAERLQGALESPRVLLATGLNGSRLIDDSYSAGPESTLEALTLLASLGGRRIAVLGNLETEVEGAVPRYWKVGNRAAMTADLLVVVGEGTRHIADEARRVGMPEGAVLEADSPDQAIDLLRSRLRPGDHVLIKGAPQKALEQIARAIRLEG